jgi:hypothetical protein
MGVPRAGAHFVFSHKNERSTPLHFGDHWDTKCDTIGMFSLTLIFSLKKQKIFTGELEDRKLESLQKGGMKFASFH